MANGHIDERPPHAVCVPFPAQGHITPMLKLAKLLHSKGFHITFVLTDYNYRRLLRSRGPDALAGAPGFRFAAFPDGLPYSDADATQRVVDLLRAVTTAMPPHFQKLLEETSDDCAVPPVTCIVADCTMTFAPDAARELGVPCALFWTSSACGFTCYLHTPRLVERGLVPVGDGGDLDAPVDCVPGLSKHMRLRDFPPSITGADGFVRRFVEHMADRMRLASAVIFNTFFELERQAIDAMAAVDVMLPPIYTVGPLVLLDGGDAEVSALRPNLWKEDRSCLEWLDKKKAGSVVYVNFGSITTLTDEQLEEFAWGIDDSGCDFLWVMRPDMVGGEAATLPPGFLEQTAGRGLFAGWCPQEEVLRHPAVGAFLTHSGWNSTLEAVCGGTPMISWPFFAEQLTNSRYKCKEWGNAVEVGSEVRRAKVAAVVREVVGGEMGKEMRRRAAEWKEKAVAATSAGGTSFVSLHKFINDVLLSATCKNK